ncbi:MAG: hypothetical protein ACLSGB_00900 [Dorea sp.]
MERREILAQHVYAITVTTDKSGKRNLFRVSSTARRKPTLQTQKYP